MSITGMDNGGIGILIEEKRTRRNVLLSEEDAEELMKKLMEWFGVE